MRPSVRVRQSLFTIGYEIWRVPGMTTTGQDA